MSVVFDGTNWQFNATGTEQAFEEIDSYRARRVGAGTIAGGGIDVADSVVRVDLPVALLVMLVALPALASGLALQPWESAGAAGWLRAYVAVLVLAGTASPAAPAAQTALMVGLVVIAVLLAVVGAVARARGGGTRSRTRVRL